MVIVRMNQNQKKICQNYAILLGVTIILVLIDQLVKSWTVKTLSDGTEIDIVRGVFSLFYVENRGAAFGIFQGKSILLGIVSILAAFFLFVVYQNIRKRRGSFWLRVVFILVISGALGNQIDRFVRGFVVDTFNFYLINFPVFNVADSYVVVGGILAVLLVIIDPNILDDVMEFRLKRTKPEDHILKNADHAETPENADSIDNKETQDKADSTDNKETLDKAIILENKGTPE